jgi:hypothetical protein
VNAILEQALPSPEMMYPLGLPAIYRLLRGTTVVASGVGVIVAMGRKSIKLLVERPLPGRTRIELLIDWPARTSDGARLRVAVEGRIVAGGAVREQSVDMRRYDFQVRVEGGNTQAAMPDDPNSVARQIAWRSGATDAQ